MSELVERRMTAARKALAEAAVLNDAGFSEAAAVRLYHSCHLCVTALLASRGDANSLHDSARMMFNTRFVLPGIVKRENGEMFGELAAIRRDVEDDECFTVDSGRLADYLPLVESFIGEIGSLLQQQG